MPGKAGRKKQILCDTSIVIGYLRGKSECKNKIDMIRKGKLIGFVSSVTVFELYIGAFCSKDMSEALRDVREILSWFQPAVNFDEIIAQKAAHLYIKLRKANQLIEFNDLFIAATGVTLGLPVCTLNLEHFQRIPELKLF
jgi:tRNA(fMet)-specific endonuclease VapC